MLTKAAALGMQFSPEDETFLMRQAGKGTCPARDAAEAVFKRALAVKLANGPLEMRELLAKLAKVCLEDTTWTHVPANLRKIASIVDGVDKACGLEKLGLRCIEDVLFKISIKEATEFLGAHTQTPSGQIYRRSDLAGLSLESLRSYCGDRVADASSAANGLFLNLEKLAAAVRTMTPDEARGLEHLLAAR